MYANCSLCGKRFQSESHIEFHVQRFYEYGEPICFISMWIVRIKGTRWQCEGGPYNWIPWESWKNLDWFSRNSWSCPRLDCTQKNNAGSIRSWFCWWFSKDNNKQAGTCISREDLSVYKSDKKSNKNILNDILLWVRI